MSSAKIIQLRQSLAEKFPGLRTRVDERPEATAPDSWLTGLRQIDERPPGGLRKGALSEIIGNDKTTGAASVIHALIRQAARTNQIIVLVDGSDSFDATGGEEGVLSHLLWIRCRSAEEALKAADLVLRDPNLPLVLLDLAGCPEVQLRRIQPTVWYRFQRLLETTSAVCAVFTRRHQVVPAQTRIVLHGRFSLAALDANPDLLLSGAAFEVFDAGSGEALLGRRHA